MSLISAGKREIHRLDKDLNIFSSMISHKSEPRSYKGPINEEVLKGIKALWFFGPQKDLTPEEGNIIEKYLLGGGNLLVFASKLNQNFEVLLKKYGVIINDSVISPVYIQYIDPHQISVHHGVVNRSLTQYANDLALTFAYPNGSTVELKHPAVPIVASGQSSYPLNRPIISYSKCGKKGGSIVFCGSPHIFCDEWIRKENNEILLKFMIDLAITKEVELNKIDAEHPEITDRWYTPDVMSMAECLRCCIQDSEKLRSNFDENFDSGLFKMDLSFISQAQDLANTIGLKYEPLNVVSPAFDTALPPLTPAVFPPQMREPPGPVLELFDLDDAFSSPKTRLAQLAQRTSPKNAEKFIIQSAKILGILPKLPEDKRSAKHVLEFVLSQVVRWKRQM